jgi:hypothetical protein
MHSIASNIKIIKDKTISSIFANYVQEFPLRKRSYVLEAQGTSTEMSDVARAKLTVVRHPKYIEEKIEYLQEQIFEVKRDTEQETNELRTKIDDLSKLMSAKTQETKAALGDVESKIEKVSV